MSKPALIVIDVQNDYFEGGAFALWQPEQALAATEKAIHAARAKGIPVVCIQHVVNGPSPFFSAGTEGVKIHDRVLAAAGDAPVVVKERADAFEGTTLHRTLRDLGVDELLVCGMMTHNCVTHTAISRQADDYGKVTVLKDACATVGEIVHVLALDALSTRVELRTVDEALA